jgi:hypothetical protein
MLPFLPMKPSLKARGTLRDVARLVGVSHTTVSNAFSRPDQLSPELRENPRGRPLGELPRSEPGRAHADERLRQRHRPRVCRSVISRF